MSLNDLHERVGASNDVLCALSLLIWDSRTMMPLGGTVTRGAQIATLTRIARELLLTRDMIPGQGSGDSGWPFQGGVIQ